jgi:predicted RNA-binding protein YlxR (DUF448 family)
MQTETRMGTRRAARTGSGDAGSRAGRKPESATRRCLVTGEVRPKDALVRFVVGPDSRLVPDIEETLPGRGLWLTARRDIVAAAAAKNLFAKAARTPVEVGADLADRVEALLARRVMELIGLARRAGLAAAGFETVRATLAAGRAAIVLAASDAAPDGRRRLRALSADVPVVDQLSAAELGAALGREHAVHGAIARGRLAGLILREAGRLAGFRAPSAGSEGAGSEMDRRGRKRRSKGKLEKNGK